MTAKGFAAFLIAAIAAVFALNASWLPIPGLEWARPASDVAKVAGQPADAGDTGGRRGGRNGAGGGRGGFDGPAPVTVAAATTADFPVYLRGVGTARALATVTVRPQVDGKLIKVHFKEGQDVKRGDLLAEIDPTTYKTQLDQAIAKRKLTQVQLENAEADLKRLTSVGPGVVTQKSVDTQRALAAQFEAQLKSDEAAIANTEAILGYTRITSPLDGRTGQRLVDEGNLIRAGDAGIVTIAQIRPLSVQFTVPQQQLSDIKAAMSRSPVPVEALASDDRTAIDTGMLTFVDNQVDQATGTVRMKADLPNADLQLWPGQFANVRIKVDTLRNAVTVPTASVQRGPSGPFVYSLSETAGATTVVVRPVTVSQQTERVSVIATGLATGERVVTTGFARLKDGAKVTVSPSPTLDQPTDKPASQQPVSELAPAAGQSAQGDARAADGKPSEGRVERRRRAEGEGRRERPVVQ
ncbi:MAG: efflux RND transporter periplasmic adaptor subunit [Hyphomicrobiaceae bacterium]|nr:efflux RND transporter periplasmic adaptor subunit [Hyphomicrobiaceae bacterium]